jgi:capsule polysaccharide export protein KpsE/RkpR
LEQANAVGANPDESPELKLAEGKLTQAQADMADRSYKDARMQAEQAELDARLAEAQVLTRKSQEQLNVLNTRITRLRKQLQLGEAQ